MNTDFDEIKQILKQLSLSQERTDAQLAKTDVQLAKTDAQLEKSAKEWKEVKRQLGDIGHSNGDAAENFFFSALEESKQLGHITFDEISRNVKQKKHRLEDEYDIFLENGNSVGIIEVKYKVKKDHIEQLINKKAQNFRMLFPDYVAYHLYVGIAGLSFEAEAEELAIENGLVVLKQKGDLVQINSGSMRAF